MSFTSLKNKRAITLIAVVITIIILLILVGVSIRIAKGKDGLINKAKEAKTPNKAMPVILFLFFIK